MDGASFKYPIDYCHLCKSTLEGKTSLDAARKYCPSHKCFYMVDQAFGTILSCQFKIGNYFFHIIYNYISCSDIYPENKSVILITDDSITPSKQYQYPKILNINADNYLQVVNRAKNLDLLKGD